MMSGIVGAAEDVIIQLECPALPPSTWLRPGSPHQQALSFARQQQLCAVHRARELLPTKMAMKLVVAQ